MAGRGGLLIGFIVVFIVGAVAGLGIGGSLGYSRGTSEILNEALAKDAGAVQSHVVTLRHFRSGQEDQAVEALEAHLDDDLIVFDPSEPYRNLTGETTSAIRKAIVESREYRLMNSRKSNRPVVDQMVESIFSRELYR